MRTIRIDHDSEILVRGHQRINQLFRALVVNVVVTRTMDYQQSFAVSAVGMNLERITVEFHAGEDRMLVRVFFNGSAEIQFWLTRRLLKRIWPVLLLSILIALLVLKPAGLAGADDGSRIEVVAGYSRAGDRSARWRALALLAVAALYPFLDQMLGLRQQVIVTSVLIFALLGYL